MKTVNLKINDNNVDYILDGLREILSNKNEEFNMISKYWKEPEDPKTLVLSNLKVTIKELEKLIKEIEELT